MQMSPIGSFHRRFTLQVCPVMVLLLSQSFYFGRAQTESPAELETQRRQVNSTLISAAERGDLFGVQLMLKVGADVNAADDHGSTALMYAVDRGHTDVVLALIQAGAKLDQAGNNGPSLLMTAVWECHDDTVRALINAGAKLAPGDWQKDRPPQFADFPVHRVYRGKPAPIDFNGNPWARTYRTRLKQAASCGANFAGHYTVAEWGCGSSCQSINFIDARDGAVIDGISADRGADYRLDSELFIENPADGEDALAYEDDPVDSISVDYYVMRDGRLTLIYSQACRVSGHRQQCGCEDLQKLVSQTAAK
jgi:ankyrin repeat protein